MLFCCICVLKNINLSNRINLAKGVKTNQISSDSFNLYRREVLHQSVNIPDNKSRRYFKHYFTKLEYDGHEQTNSENVYVFWKTLDRIGKSKKTRYISKYIPSGFGKTKSMKRLKRQVASDKQTASQKIEILKAAVPSEEIRCSIQSTIDNCILVFSRCFYSELESYDKHIVAICAKPALDVTLHKCFFKDGILQEPLFNGLIPIHRLVIMECQIKTIMATAFQSESFKYLESLVLIDNQLITLKENTFDGLFNLYVLVFKQNSLDGIFEAEAFFKPLANNLQKAVIQLQNNTSKIIDPLHWWRGLKMNSLLDLDLTNTNLQGVLNELTFQAFVRLQSLTLKNCSLFSIETNVFLFVLDDLRFLDLQSNHLKTLDSTFLQAIAISSLSVNFDNNDWFCDCKGEMLQYIVNKKFYLSYEWECSSPAKFAQMKFEQVVQKCTENRIFTFLPQQNFAITSFSNSTPTELEIANNTTTAINTTAIVATSSSSISVSTASPPLPSLTAIECFASADKTEISYHHLLTPAINFTLYTVSATRVLVTVEATKHILPHVVIIYFSNHTNYGYVSDLKEQNYIDELESSTAYVICLFGQPTLAVSPFDCQAYVADGQKQQQQTRIWLLEKDKVGFISLVLIITILLLISSLLITFKLLRSNPQWLLKCHRHRPRFIYSSGKAVISARISSSQPESHPSSRVAENSLQYLKPRPPVQNAGDTVIYYSQHAVPLARPPHVPPSEKFCTDNNRCSSAGKDHSRTTCEINSQAYATHLNIIEAEPDYQTIDCFEVVNN